MECMFKFHLILMSFVLKSIIFFSLNYKIIESEHEKEEKKETKRIYYF